MQTFFYTALDTEGNSSKGKLNALSKEQAVRLLRERGLIVTSVTAEHKFELSSFLTNLRGVPTAQKIVFTRQLGTMIDSGLPITQALKILEKQSKHEVMQKAIQQVVTDIDGGKSLHESLGSHPNIFSRLYLSLIKAGEASGNLDEILNRLADSMQAEADFKGRVKGAMIYPSIIVVVMLGVLILMFVFVIPRLSSLYEEMGAELPVITRVLLNISKGFVQFWWMGILGSVVAFFALRSFTKKKSGQYFSSDMKSRLPVFGSLLKEVELTSFTRTLGMLMDSGVSILESLDISKETLNNLRLRDGVDEVAKAVEKGKPLAEPLRANEIFPPIMAEMIAVGEQTGKVDEILKKVAEYFGDESTRTTENLAAALEPIIMVVLGVVVGILVVALILPIYSLTSQF